MIDTQRLARTAYYATTRRVTEAQQRLVLRKALLAEFGADALPVNAMHHTLSTLADAAEHHARAERIDRDAIAEGLEIIREMEAVFAKQHDADLEAFAQHLRREHGR